MSRSLTHFLQEMGNARVVEALPLLSLRYRQWTAQYDGYVYRAFRNALDDWITWYSKTYFERASIWMVFHVFNGMYWSYFWLINYWKYWRQSQVEHESRLYKKDIILKEYNFPPELRDHKWRNLEFYGDKRPLYNPWKWLPHDADEMARRSLADEGGKHGH
eukprot:TRINITY_DN556_c0_g1_i1.p1 TRINITY_DN556_c0_g1~~TRINITY_DN556_c0_g1_i1.p1  ORF type:complete len:168 (+),score=13.38 TRINITY_DN556_c0_g1_i1:22-504(+)